MGDGHPRDPCEPTTQSKAAQVAGKLDMHSTCGYAFNLERLWQYAFPKALKRMTIEGGWLKDAFTESMKQAINDQGWKAELVENDKKLKLVR